MEPMEAVFEGEWSSLSGIYTAEEAQFMAQLLENAPLNTEPASSSGLLGSLPVKEWNVEHSSLYHHSIGFSSTGVIFPLSSGNESDNLYLRDNINPTLDSSDGSISIDSGLIGQQDFLYLDMAGKNLLHLGDEQEEAKEEKKNGSLESSRKRSRSTGNVQKMKRNVKSKKSQTLEFSSRNKENSNAQVYKQSSSSCCSEDDSSISQGQNGGPGSSKEDPMALNLSGKTRASRGSATDPQSLYARRRRERINERLKILQGLVPNGTKVDISTMLEEAVHYVKFLQLQIKLLSSDDMWMYAPIAYNGINIGLDLKI